MRRRAAAPCSALCFGAAALTASGALAQAPPALAPDAAWLARGGAQLQVLDKINDRDRLIEVRDGAAANVGSLSIAVRSCLVRPPDKPPDAAAFLVITDSHSDAPGFRGWMFRSDPAASMMEHPIYDVRVLGCRA